MKNPRRSGALIMLYTVILGLGVFLLIHFIGGKKAMPEGGGVFGPATPIVTVTSKPDFDPASFPPTPEGKQAMWEQLGKLRAANPDWDWQRPIVFYGVVVDQDNRPVAGAGVSLQWSAVGATPERHLVTGADGRFEVRDIVGKRLLVWVAKEGYHEGPLDRGTFEYANPDDAKIYHVPDPAKPAIFSLEATTGRGTDVFLARNCNGPDGRQ